jgi:hypothetical protein
MRSVVSHIVVFALAVGGCSSEDDPGFTPGTRRDSGPGDGPGSGGDGTVNLDSSISDINRMGPIITITEPDMGGLIFSGQVRVRATVVDDGLDAASVVVNVAQEEGGPTLSQRRMDLVDSSMDLWEAIVPLGGVPGGTLYVGVSASDTDDPVNSNTTWLQIKNDDGPDIQFFSPAQDGIYFHESITYSFRVRYDAGTAPTTTPACGLDEVSVSGVTFSPTLTVTDPCTYEGSIDFVADFDPDLIDNQYVLVVRATNGTGTQSTALRTFHVDNTGPSIVFHEDYVVDNAVIGGTVELRVKVSDPSGVDTASVNAQVSGSATPSIPLLPAAPGEYSAVYDTSELDSVIASPSISVTAADLWNNQSTSSIVVHIDNAPPVISLHPPNLRNNKVESGIPHCSWRFDPVGSDTADDPLDDPDFLPGFIDGMTGLPATEPDVPKGTWCQPQVFFLRARVEDAGNTRPGQVIIYPSYVDEDTVELFAYDGTEPLIVDQDSDGFCDDINPSLEPTPAGLPGEAWHNTMNAIEVRGTEDFTPDGTAIYPVGCTPGVNCSCEPGVDAENPAPLCQASPLTSASFHGSNVGVPVIYTLGEPMQGADCTGTQFDTVGNGFSGGWLCLAVRARDHVGNVGISDPMRVYVDLDPTNWCASPPPANTAPDCTDGCGYHAWPNNGVFPPFPQLFIPASGHPQHPFGEVHRVQ